MDDYNDIRELLTPRRNIKASKELKKRIDSAIEKKHRTATGLKWLWGGLSTGAIAALVILSLIPKGMSAKDILTSVLHSMHSIHNIEMVVEVRTTPMENFKFINSKNDFVTHKINISQTDSFSTWRVDKGNRVAVGYNKNIYTWITPLDIGWNLPETEPAEVLGYMEKLLSPREILKKELEQCHSDNTAEYTVSKNENNDIVLTIHAKAQGEFENPYMLNTSIAESENIRRYVIDNETMRLKTASVSIIDGKKTIEVLRIVSISYGLPSANSFSLPAGIRFIEPASNPDGIPGLNAEETATVLLNALSQWDISVINRLIDPAISETMYHEQYSGAELVSVGSPFRSGNENSIFIPATMRLKNGSIVRPTLVLQQNATGRWIAAGGL